MKKFVYLVEFVERIKFGNGFLIESSVSYVASEKKTFMEFVKGNKLYSPGENWYWKVSKRYMDLGKFEAPDGEEILYFDRLGKRLPKAPSSSSSSQMVLT